MNNLDSCDNMPVELRPRAYIRTALLIYPVILLLVHFGGKGRGPTPYPPEPWGTALIVAVPLALVGALITLFGSRPKD